MAPPFIADEGCERTYPDADFTQWWKLLWLANLAQLTELADSGGSAAAPTGMAA